MAQRIKFTNKTQLTLLNETAAKLNYNRQLVPEAIDALHDDAYVAILPILIHEHAQGKPVDPHLRCSLHVFGEPAPLPAMLDVPMDLFELLAEIDVAELADSTPNAAAAVVAAPNPSEEEPTDERAPVS